MHSTMTEELYEPHSYADAIQSTDASRWEAAIKVEYNSVMPVYLKITPWTHSHKISLGF
jgi:hypothetical protein